jgi:methoxymalonate biosynthesis acyl carrier protein
MSGSASLDVRQEIAHFFSNVLGIEVPSPTTDLFHTGILDSQNLIELLVHLERMLQAPVRLDDFEIEQFRCIEKIANLVFERRAAAERRQ